MAKWLIDTGNTKKGFYFSKVQDVVSHAYLKEENSEYIPVLGGQNMYAAHSQTDPNNIIIFEKQNEDGSFVTSIGLKRFDLSTSQPLRLDEIKAYLDSAEAELSPVVALQYQFETADADVSNSEAIENARYITKVTDAEGNSKIVDILTDETVWDSPELKHVINYLFIGKIKSIPDTYYILLNGFRTELYQQLQQFGEHTFEYLDQATGSFKNYFIRPTVENGKLFDDVIFAEAQSLKLKVFGDQNFFLSSNNLTANDVDYKFESSVSCVKDADGNLDIDMGDKTTAFVSVFIPSNNMLDVTPDMSIRRTFTIHRS